MSEPGDEKPKAPTVPEPSPWVSREGDVVHPDAPAGSGGLGRFRTAGALGADGNDSFDVRHPRAPSVRFETLSGEEKAEVLDGGVKVTEPVRNPPPVTVTEKFTLKASAKPRVKITAQAEVVADGKKPNPVGDAGAQTVLNPAGVTAKKPQYALPPGAPDPAPDSQPITGVVGDIVIEGTATIQVKYGDDSKPTAPAAWGRGTTPDDVTKKDTTVGFHESCHLADYKTYLKTTAIDVPLGIFTAKTIAEWDTAAAAIDAALNDHFKACADASRAKTDEVGTKMSDYVSTHAGVSGH
jgi:hypothetical protein